jgi:spore coat protein U-like protein
MKKIFAVAAMSVFVVAMTSSVFAGSVDTTTPVVMSGKVIAKCQFNTQTAALDFPSIDFSSGLTAYAANVTGGLTGWCTNGGATYQVTALSANNAAVGAAPCSGAGITGILKTGGGGATKEITYTFKCADLVGAGFGSGNDKSLNPTATIDETNATNMNAIAGNYSDTVTVTLNY